MDYVSTRTTGRGVARALDPGAPQQVTPTAQAVTVDLKNAQPLDERQAGWLDTLQGNILRGHGRSYAVYLNLRLPDDAAAAWHLVSGLTTTYVTSARQQFDEWSRHREFKLPGGVFGTLALSASGYRRLGARPEGLFPAPADADGAPVAKPSLFAVGMDAARAALGDSPDAWQAPYGAPGSIDAILILAHNHRDELLAAARKALEVIEAQHGTVVGVEHGAVLRNERNEGIEHFGFVDGRSQPQYVASEELKLHGFALATDRWNPFEPLRRVLVRDPGTDDLAATAASWSCASSIRT